MSRGRRAAAHKPARARQAEGGDRALTVVGREFRLPYARFSFQQTIYCYSSPHARASELERLGYPVEGAVEAYVAARGHQKRQDADLARRIWGDNVFDIPMPAFFELFKVRGMCFAWAPGVSCVHSPSEPPSRASSTSTPDGLSAASCPRHAPQEHAVAPFFVFQVVCVLLWSLDDYWYYSLMTLALLVVFEATVCNQRQRSLELLRSMRRPAYPLYAYREGSWQLLSSEALVPGEDHVFWVGAWDLPQPCHRGCVLDRGGSAQGAPADRSVCLLLLVLCVCGL
jgi:cation-transporting ATPase 13A1